MSAEPVVPCPTTTFKREADRESTVSLMKSVFTGTVSNTNNAAVLVKLRALILNNFHFQFISIIRNKIYYRKYSLTYSKPEHFSAVRQWFTDDEVGNTKYLVTATILGAYVAAEKIRVCCLLQFYNKFRLVDKENIFVAMPEITG